jgi:hypothetical protein
MSTAKLFNRRCRKQEIAIPVGHYQIKEGLARLGDYWWRWSDASWQPISRHAFLHSDVQLLQCVIRPEVDEFP